MWERVGKKGGRKRGGKETQSRHVRKLEGVGGSEGGGKRK